MEPELKHHAVLGAGEYLGSHGLAETSIKPGNTAQYLNCHDRLGGRRSWLGLTGGLPADIAGRATSALQALSEVTKQKCPAAFLGACVCHDLIKFFKLVGLANLKGLKIDREFFWFYTLDDAKPSAAKGGDIGGLTPVCHLGEGSP